MRQNVVRIAFVILFALCSMVVAEQVIGTSSGKVYHNHPKECGSAKRIGDDNIARFASREEAERAGRRQCKRCARLDEKAKEAAAEEASPQRPTGGPNEGGRMPPVRLASDRSSPMARNAILPQFAHATNVIDCGTIELDTGDKACLLGVIVPRRGQPAARDAHRFIEEQTRDRLLELSGEGIVSGVIERDPLGRLRVAIAPQGGRDLAGELLFHGYAWLDRDRVTGRTAEYARLEAAAWSARRGVWRELSGDLGERVVVTGRGSTLYHDAKCDHVPHLTHPMQMKVNEARARRLAPCDAYRAKGREHSGQDSA